MGMNHARVYSEISDLVGIADINEKNGKRIARRFGAEYFKDYHGLLGRSARFYIWGIHLLVQRLV